MIIQALDFSKECLFSNRQEGMPVDSLVLHCVGYSAEETIENFKQLKVSAHYVIDLDGKIIQLVDENKSAWHTGQSFWHGSRALNYTSIGIEVCSLSLGQEPYADCQINALMGLCHRIIEQYGILPRNVIGHSDVAPARRADPGRAFPWEYLAQNGIGLWYDLEDSTKVSINNEVKLLASIGYDVSNPLAAKWAFFRHFLGHAVPYEKDILHLAENPVPLNCQINDEHYFSVLKAVSYQYNK